MVASFDVGLVVYGLLRSAQMTHVTYASLREYVIKAVALRDADKIVVSVDGESRWLPQTFRFHNASRVLPGAILNASAAYVRAMGHVLYGLNVLRHCRVIVVSRVDVEYASYLSHRSLVPDAITIPVFQHHGGLNDRFCVGGRSTLLRWFERRLSLAQNGEHGEMGACKAARHLKLNFSTTDIRFVRRRADLFVPDIDKATVWKSVPVRPWMRLHARSCLNSR